MTQFLPGSVYEPARQARNEARYTYIEDVPQSNQPSYNNRAKLVIPSFKRVSALANGGPDFTPSSDQTSDASSMWSHRTSQSSYDSLYDVTDDDVEEVPIKLSASVKRQARTSKERSRYPSLVIPSPSAWPTIQKLQRQQSPCTVGLSPASKIAITPAALATFNARLLQSPSTSSAPSLDGSQTSEELSHQSCPSTPDLGDSDNTDDEWDQPMQLDPHAFEVLHQLQSPVGNPNDDITEQVITVSAEAIQEMREIVKTTPLCPEFALSADQSLGVEGEEIVSALSIPSPGGFFSSLAPCAAQTWSRRTPEPSTGVAEDFYGVPWRAHDSNDAPAIPSLHLSIPRSESSSPIPALTLVLSPSDCSEVTELTEAPDSFDHAAAYEAALRQNALEHSDRTKHWLHAQESYLSRICQEKDTDDEETTPRATPTSPDQERSPVLDAASPSKKSVRFVDGLDAIVAEIKKDTAKKNNNLLNDPVFYQACQHITNLTGSRDAYIHRQTRAEAVHVQRSNMPQAHCRQLLGDYHISTPIRPAPMRPVSNMLPATPDDDSRKAMIATAERERQALDQIKPSVWALEAERQLNGGKLLTSPIGNNIHELPDARVLDYGGQAAGGWGWRAALEYRNATVYTLPISNNEGEVDACIAKGPSNHRTLPVSKPSNLPFPNDYFDVISARTLHTLLRAALANESPQTPLFSPHQQTAAEGKDNDEWDHALAEIYRVLKPGGFLEYNVYDASLVHPGPLGLALSVEFSFNLRTRGYDPCASRSFIPRLYKAGFGDIRRAWVVLPMADVRPRWTDSGKTGCSGAAGDNGAVAGTSTKFFSTEKGVGPDGQVEFYQAPLMGSTADVQAITGLAGARAWEQWMLKLGAEMGRPEEQTIEQVMRVLEEGGSGGKQLKEKSAWMCLKGWARK